MVYTYSIAVQQVIIGSLSKRFSPLRRHWYQLASGELEEKVYKEAH